MARQSRKGKNELDIILEQLKKSYGSEPTESLEDDLLKSSHSDDDAELNDLLNMIFDKSDEKVELDDVKTASAEESESTDNEEISEETQSDDASADDIVEDESIESESEVEKIGDDEDPVEKDMESDTENKSDVIDNVDDGDTDEITVEPTDESDQVGHVLDLMFNHGTSSNEVDEDIADDTDESEIDESDTLEDIEEFVDEDTDNDIENDEDPDILIDEEDVASEDLLEDVATFDSDIDIDTDDADELFIDDEDNVSFDTFFEDIDNDTNNDENSDMPDETTFAVEDEEYDVSTDTDDDEETAILTDDLIEDIEEIDVIDDAVPKQHIIYSADQYVHDPLQSSSPSFNLPGYEDNIEEQAEDVTEPTANLALIDNTTFDNNDISMLLKLGYDNEVKSKVGREKTQNIIVEQENSFKPDKHAKPFGYCNSEIFNRQQFSKIKEKYRTNKITTIISLTLVSILSALLLSIDIFYIFFSSRIEFFPVALAFEFLFIVLLGLVLHHKVLSGISKMAKFEADSSSLPVFLGFAYMVYLLIALLVYLIKYPAFNTYELTLFGFCLSIYAVLDVVSDLLNCIRESNTFNIIESSNEIYIAEKQTEISRNDTGKHSATDNTYRIQKTSLISGYFKRNFVKPTGKINIIFEFGVIPAIGLAAACAVTLTSNSIMAGLSMLMMTIMLGIPFSSLFIYSLLEFVVSKRLLKTKTSFVGYEAAEELSKADMLIFNDTDAVTVTSFTEIVPGKNNDSQTALNIAFDVFETLGGPMAIACEEHSKKDLSSDHPLIINDITENGIDLYYNNAINVLIGDKYFMKAHKIKVKIDTNLSTAAKGIDRSVIYMAFDGVPKLGFIINSKIKSDFLDIVPALSKVNVRSMVETFEPQINDIYFEQNIGSNTSAIGVLKQSDFESAMPNQICSSGVVSAADSLSVANAVLLSHEVAHIRKRMSFINRMVMIGELTVAVVMSVLYCLGSYYNLLFDIHSNAVAVLYITAILGAVPCIIKLLLYHCKHAKKKTEKHTKK